MSFVPSLPAQRPISSPGTTDPLDTSPIMLDAYHRAHALELRSIIADLPLRANQHVLDLACGNGTYTCWLAERVAPYGTVTGVDSSRASLQLAQRQLPQGEQIRFQQGDIGRLPFDYAIFDLVWYAQSFSRLTDPRGALQELLRVTRSGGTIALFEHDLLHHPVMLWPPELELILHQMQHAALPKAATGAMHSAGGRDLMRLFMEAGLQDCTFTPYTSSRTVPLSTDERLFLNAYLSDLLCRSQPYLSFESYQYMQALLAPLTSISLLDQPGFTVTYVSYVACGRKP